MTSALYRTEIWLRWCCWSSFVKKRVPGDRCWCFMASSVTRQVHGDRARRERKSDGLPLSNVNVRTEVTMLKIEICVSLRREWIESNIRLDLFRIWLDVTWEWLISRLYWPMFPIWWPWRNPSPLPPRQRVKRSSYPIEREFNDHDDDAFSSPSCLFVSTRVRSVTHKHLQKMYENTFEKIFNQQIGSFFRHLTQLISPRSMVSLRLSALQRILGNTLWRTCPSIEVLRRGLSLTLSCSILDDQRLFLHSPRSNDSRNLKPMKNVGKWAKKSTINSSWKNYFPILM